MTTGRCHRPSGAEIAGHTSESEASPERCGGPQRDVHDDAQCGSQNDIPAR